MSTQIDRKELKRPDAFMEKASSIAKFINDNARAVLAGLGVLLILALIATFLNSRNDKKAQAADSALYEARHELAEQLAKLPADTKNWQDSAKAGLEKVEKVTKDFSGSRAAFEANLLLGDVHFVRKDAAKAAEYFQKAISAATPRAAKASAQYALAYAYEETKEYDKAIDAMRHVVSSSDKTLRGDAMMAIGRLQTLKGDKPKALDAYNQVLKDFPNTPLAKLAEARITLLR